MTKEIKLLTISYAKRALQEGSREQERMQQYAEAVSRYDVVIFTRKSDNLPEKYTLGNLVVYGTNTRTRVGMLYAAYKIGKKILKDSSESQWIVSTQDPFETSVVGRALSRAANAMHHVQLHGDPFSNKSWKWESYGNALRAIYGRFVVRRAAAIRVVSKRAKESLVALGVSSEKITVLPIQQDLSHYLKVGLHRTYEQKDTCTITYIGRLSPEKNIDRIIRVFADAYQKNNTLRLRIVGDGVCSDALHSRVAKRNLSSAVSFVSWTEDIPAELRRADVFVLASSHEGYGLVLVEAMASGVPVVTTDVGCVGDVFEHDKDGFVVSFNDDAAFTSALLTLANDAELRMHLGKHAYKTILAQDDTQQRYVECWKESFHAM